MAIWAYPDGKSYGDFIIPTYNMTVTGIDKDGNSVTEAFEVLRFGVESVGTERPRVVGLKGAETDSLTKWLPAYQVHSAPTSVKGAWVIRGNYLIHNGPTRGKEDGLFGSTGCIEVMGGRFLEFNTLLRQLTCADTNEEVSKSGSVSLQFQPTEWPQLRPVHKLTSSHQ